MVMVLIFAVGALALVSTLLALTDASGKVEGGRHRDKTLHAVAMHGLATAINEVNRKRSTAGYADPSGNGFGCVLVGPDGKRGWPVLAADGRVLGRYTTMVTTDATRRVLSAVVVEKEFPADWAAAEAQLEAGTLRVATAEWEIFRALLGFDRNALSVRGNATAGGRQGIFGGSNQVKIFGNEVPAVNISDPAAHALFVERDQLSRWGALTGLDPATGSEAIAVAGEQEWEVRRKTVTNEESGLLSQETMTQIADGINARVAGVIATGTPVATTNGTLPTGTYFIDSTLNIPSGQTLTGSGTLVINKGVTITGKLNWTGDIIVANSDDATVTVKGELNVDGVLGIQGMGSATSMGVLVDSGGKVTVGTDTNPGAFTMLGSNTTQSPLRFNSGSNGAQVKGIMTVMGNDMRMVFDTGAKVDVQGSLAFVTPTDATNGLEVEFRNGAHLTASYTARNFDAALNALGRFYDPNANILPVEISGYLEDPSRRLTLLRQHVEADPSQSYGME